MKENYHCNSISSLSQEQAGQLCFQILGALMTRVDYLEHRTCFTMDKLGCFKVSNIAAHLSIVSTERRVQNAAYPVNILLRIWDNCIKPLLPQPCVKPELGGDMAGKDFPVLKSITGHLTSFCYRKSGVQCPIVKKLCTSIDRPRFLPQVTRPPTYAAMELPLACSSKGGRGRASFVQHLHLHLVMASPPSSNQTTRSLFSLACNTSAMLITCQF